MFVKKSSGSLHYVNTALYQKLEENYFICENDNAYLCEDNASVEGNEFIISQLNQRKYDISKIKDKRIRNQIISVLSQKILDNPNNIKQIFDDFVANPDSIFDNQEQDTTDNQQSTQNQEEPTPDQKNGEETQQTEEPKEKEPISQGSEQQKQQVKQFATKMSNAYIDIIKKSGAKNEIIEDVNQKHPNENYFKLEEIPADELLESAKRNKRFVKFLLTTRLDNGVNSLNIPDAEKKTIKFMLEDDLKSKNEILRIVGWLNQKNGANYSIFDFPITDYYVKKYNKTISSKALDTLAKGIAELNNGNWKFGDSELKEFVKENNLSDIKDEKSIYNKLKKNYSNDFLMYVLNNNDKNINPANIDNMNANDVATLLMGDKFTGNKIVKDVEMILRQAMFQATLIPFIDYLMYVDYNKRKGDTEEYAIKITMFNKFSSSQVLQKARDLITEEGLPFKMDGLKPKISAFYSEISDTVFKDTETGDTCRVRFQKGFPILKVIAQNVKQGYQIGKQNAPLLKY